MKQLIYLIPYLLGFFGIKVVKGQHEFRSINCLSIVNKIFHTYFHSYMDASVWKSTRIAVNRCIPGSENSNISG